MLLVLIVHANFKALSMPTSEDLYLAPFESFMRFFCESISIVCVNVFVLISGWFGIHPKRERIIEFIFQVFFIISIIDLFFLFTDNTTISSLSGKQYIQYFFHDNYWFVGAYLILYLLSPTLNLFVQQTNKQHLLLFLLFFFTLQTIYGYIFPHSWYAKGYSPLSFIGLYTLARYVRTYSNSITKLNKYLDISIFFISSLVITLIAIIFVIKEIGDPWKLFFYSSPLVIIESLYLLLFFTKMSFNNKGINWIATSCFSAYLFHCHPLFLDNIYIRHIKLNFYEKDTLLFILDTTTWILTIFAFSIIIDKIRIITWKSCIFIKNYIMKIIQ